MKKLLKKKAVQKKTHVTRKSLNRGALGAGTAYAILAMLIIFAASSMMIGSITPGSGGVGQEVVLLSITPGAAQNNLQLFTFPGATYTPTPSPTLAPQPQQSSGSSYSSGSSNPGSSYPGTGSKSGSYSGGGGGSSCFPAGTKILMADGSQKNIEAVNVGDKVIGFDGTVQTQETVLQLESPIRDHLYKLSFADGTDLELTREHPLYTAHGWAAIAPEATAKENPQLHVKKLSLGDKVLESNGSYVAIVAMKYIPGNVQTYNLKRVSNNNDFYANGKLAHNKGSTKSSGGGGGGGSSGGGGGGGGSSGGGSSSGGGGAAAGAR